MKTHTKNKGLNSEIQRFQNYTISKNQSKRTRGLDTCSPLCLRAAVPKKPLSILSTEKHQREIRVTHTLYHN